MDTNTHVDWHEFLSSCELNKILEQIYVKDEIVYPEEKHIFKALKYFGPSEINLVIIGQDPYISYEIHNNKKIPQAMGLAFSIPESHKKIPPSLKNIFKEIKNCYPDYEIPEHGSLKRWAKEEKILLLNASLTVIEGKSNSHAHLWKDFTDKLIEFVSNKNTGTNFLLMGSFAQQKEKLIDSNKHKIFKCVHPSPLSAYRGFFGSEIFKKINNKKINW
jgi:uracil-DNA glycosylase